MDVGALRPRTLPTPAEPSFAGVRGWAWSRPGARFDSFEPGPRDHRYKGPRRV